MPCSGQFRSCTDQARSCPPAACAVMLACSVWLHRARCHQPFPSLGSGCRRCHHSGPLHPVPAIGRWHVCCTRYGSSWIEGETPIRAARCGDWLLPGLAGTPPSSCHGPWDRRWPACHGGCRPPAGGRGAVSAGRTASPGAHLRRRLPAAAGEAARPVTHSRTGLLAQLGWGGAVTFETSLMWQAGGARGGHYEGGSHGQRRQGQDCRCDVPQSRRPSGGLSTDHPDYRSLDG